MVNEPLHAALVNQALICPFPLATAAAATAAPAQSARLTGNRYASHVKGGWACRTRAVADQVCRIQATHIALLHRAGRHTNRFWARLVPWYCSTASTGVLDSYNGAMRWASQPITHEKRMVWTHKLIPPDGARLPSPHMSTYFRRDFVTV